MMPSSSFNLAPRRAPHRIPFAPAPGFNYVSDIFTLLVVCIIVSTTMPQTADWMEDYMKLPIMLMETILLKDVALCNIFKSRGLTVKEVVVALRNGVRKHHASKQPFGVCVFLEGPYSPSFTLREGFFEFFKKLLDQVLKNPPRFPWISIDGSTVVKTDIRQSQQRGYVIYGHHISYNQKLQLVAIAGYAGFQGEQSGRNVTIYRIVDSKLEYVTHICGGYHVIDIAYCSKSNLFVTTSEKGLRVFTYNDDGSNFRKVRDCEDTSLSFYPRYSAKDPIVFLDFQSDGNRLVTINKDGTVKLFQIDEVSLQLSVIFSFKAHPSVGRQIRFVPGKPYQIIACVEGNLFQCWEFKPDYSDCALVWENRVMDQLFNPKIVFWFDPFNLRRLALFNFEHSEIQFFEITEKGLSQVKTFNSGVSGITAFCWNPEIQGVFAVGGERSEIAIFQIDTDTDTVKKLYVFDQIKSQSYPEIKSLKFTSQQQLVVAFNSTNFVLTWEWDKKNPLY